MATWITLPSVSLTNGSNTVSVTGSFDLSAIKAGWALIISNNYVEIASGTAADTSGNSMLTLALPWDGSVVINQPAKIQPTGAPFLDGIAALEATNEYAIDVHNALAESATEDKDVTITDRTGTEHTFASMPKNARLVQEMINEGNQSINGLLANKTANGDDTTEGALLAVGATVKQLDLTNSNVKFEPSVKPTLSADFVNNKYTLYDSETNTFVDKSFSEVFDFSRATPTTATSPTGKTINIGIDKPAFDFKQGVPQGLRTNQRHTNLVKWSEDVSGPSWNRGNTTYENRDGYQEVIASTSLSATHFIDGTRPIMEAGGVFTSSITLAPLTTRYVRYRFYGALGDARSVDIDLQDKVITFTDPSLTAWLEEHPSNSTIHVKGVATLDDDITSRLFLLNNEGDVTFVSSGESVKFYRHQFTKTPYPMPYEKTEGEQVTIEPDKKIRVLSDEFNLNECTYFTELAIDTSIVGNFRGVSLFIGDNDVNFGLMKSSNVSYLQWRGTGVSTTSLPENDGEFHKYAVSWKDGLMNVFMDGIKVGVSTYETLPSVTTLRKGVLNSTQVISTPYINVKSERIYPAALSESDCIQLTRGAN